MCNEQIFCGVFFLGFQNENVVEDLGPVKSILPTANASYPLVVLVRTWSAWPRGYNSFFSCSTQLSMMFSLLINVKMPTIASIVIFISRDIFMFRCFCCKKEFAIVSNHFTGGEGVACFALRWFQACILSVIICLLYLLVSLVDYGL